MCGSSIISSRPSDTLSTTELKGRRGWFDSESTLSISVHGRGRRDSAKPSSGHLRTGPTLVRAASLFSCFLIRLFYLNIYS